MKKHNLSSLIFLTIFSIAPAFSCDDQLKIVARNADEASKLTRECDIQDRFQKVKGIFHENNLDINNVAEYRAIRLIDRLSWEKNAQNNTLAAQWIYNPAPTTWDVWNNGIKILFESKENIPDNVMDLKYLSHVNTVLLSDGKNNVKDIISDQGLKLGELRKSMFDSAIGFCMGIPEKTLENIITESTNASQAYFDSWESNAGVTLKELVKIRKGPSASRADLAIGLSLSGLKCSTGTGSFVEYISSSKVTKTLEWLNVFIDYNAKKYKEGHLVISPIELSAIVQKTFVTVHPFADGNGRTSRAIQDLILEKFGMPYAPGGDLQNDVLEHPEQYINNTYTKMESMLTFLEGCATSLQDGQKLNARCQSINE
jgi:hypothetical protein